MKNIEKLAVHTDMVGPVSPMTSIDKHRHCRIHSKSIADPVTSASVARLLESFFEGPHGRDAT
jgi:hypothetical protein